MRVAKKYRMCDSRHRSLRYRSSLVPQSDAVLTPVSLRSIFFRWWAGDDSVLPRTPTCNSHKSHPRKPVGLRFWCIPCLLITKVGVNTHKYTILLDYTMTKPRWFVIWDCSCTSRNMSNRYEHDFPMKKRMRYFCRGCGSFKRMDSQQVNVKLITQSIKKATAVMLDE